jgi:inorganic pyrophosphatase
MAAPDGHTWGTPHALEQCCFKENELSFTMSKRAVDQLEPVDKKRNCLNVIIETPKGSRVKYSYEENSGLFMLSKVLPEGMVFPFNFGFVPKTLAADGDPLDILILNEEPLVSGCFVKVKPIAVIKATQTEDGKPVRNDRVIGQAIGKEVPLEKRNLKLDRVLVSQIEFFFTAYNKLYGKTFKVLGAKGPKKAREIVDQAIRLKKKKKGS